MRTKSARTSILAGATAPRPDTLTQTGQITSHKPLSDGAGNTFFKRQPEPGDRRPHRAVAQANLVLGQQPCLQRRQCQVRVGRDVCRQRCFLHRRELARSMTAPRAGARLPGATAPDQCLVNVRHADPEQLGCRPRRHTTVDRRQHPRPQILRVALPLPPRHRRPHNLWSGPANHTSSRVGIPFRRFHSIRRCSS